MKHLSPTPKIFFFFFNDTATTEIYTLSLHDALPISAQCRSSKKTINGLRRASSRRKALSSRLDRKSTRLNSSHSQISYAVFCLKKKKQTCLQDPPNSPKLRRRRASEPSTI